MYDQMEVNGVSNVLSHKVAMRSFYEEVQIIMLCVRETYFFVVIDSVSKYSIRLYLLRFAEAVLLCTCTFGISVTGSRPESINDIS